jgi:hypothetical protein
MCIRLSCILLCLWVTAVEAEQQVMGAAISSAQYWDSNFSRSPDAVPEQIVQSFASVKFDKNYNRQQFIARWKGVDYRHKYRDELDARFNLSKLAWLGQWGEEYSSEFSITRDAYPVNRLEFIDKDIVSKDDMIAKMGYGSGERLVFYGGARRTNQQHSALARDGLDFDEQESFVELAYKTAAKSLFSLRYKIGDRQYPHASENLDVGELNFDYRQAEVETLFQLTAKTQLTASLAYFDRGGILNKSKGSFSTVDFIWKASDKLDLKIGYLHKQPALGEFSDSPADSKRFHISSEWKLTPKITMSAKVYSEEQSFDGSNSIAREERVSVISPLNAVFNYSETLSIYVTSEREKRQSLLSYRNYTSLQASLGLAVRF